MVVSEDKDRLKCLNIGWSELIELVPESGSGTLRGARTSPLLCSVDTELMQPANRQTRRDSSDS